MRENSEMAGKDWCVCHLEESEREGEEAGSQRMERNGVCQ